MKVEYLVTIETKDAFCKTKKSFLNFIQSDSDITLSGKKLTYKNNVFSLEVSEENSPSEKHKIFHLKISNENENKTEDFSTLLKVLRGLLQLASKNNIQTLWDDISYTYSFKCYPVIYEIENLMRKLITKFMLTNVGVGWTETAIPDELRKNRREKSAGNGNNYLYEADFIQLSNFLFDSYRTQDIDGLINKIKTHKESSIELDEVKGYIPLSNWQRYFQKYVGCEASYLKTRWERLYILRCKIAHNSSFDKSDYDELNKISDELKPILEEAISSLDKITVPEDEREELAENVAINQSQFYGDFLLAWKDLETKTYELAYKCGLYLDSKARPIVRVANELYEKSIITDEVYTQIAKLTQIRNVIVHGAKRGITIDDLEYYTQLLKSTLTML